MSLTLDALRRYAVARSLFKPIPLQRALDRLGFVQADPIRAPARAQDLILRHRARNYRAGDLERRYVSLDADEDFFVNYGFVTGRLSALMHPRASLSRWSPVRKARAADVLALVRERGRVHPREVEAEFAHGSVTNAWGGTSVATTRLLDDMHYRGLLRVVGRKAGIRMYAAHVHIAAPNDKPARQARLDVLIDAVVNVYAPLPAATLSWLVRRLRYAAPQLRREIVKGLDRARQRLAHARVEGVDWYWPRDDTADKTSPTETVRLLAPFDPVVWDRRRFEILWGWTYRFEAYVPPSKRKLGYYALPLLWRDQIVGWGNVAVKNGAIAIGLGFIDPLTSRDPVFARAMDEERERMSRFLGA